MGTFVCVRDKARRNVGFRVHRVLTRLDPCVCSNVALPASTLIARVRTEAGPGGAGQGTSIRTGGWLQVRPDITVQPGARAVLALGETKLKPKSLRMDKCVCPLWGMLHMHM